MNEEHFDQHIKATNHALGLDCLIIKYRLGAYHITMLKGDDVGYGVAEDYGKALEEAENDLEIDGMG